MRGAGRAGRRRIEPHRCAASTGRGSSSARGSPACIGPNGAGKTNLLEALYFALTGRSFRTRRPPRPDPLRRPLARAEATCRDEDGIERPAARLGQPHRGPPPPARRQPGRPGDDRPQPPAGRGLLPRPAGAGQGPAGGAPRPPRRLRRRPLAGPRRSCASAYGQALAQRNALLAPVAPAAARPAELDAWDAALAERGGAAGRGPRRGASASSPRPFAAAASELGLEGGASLEYAPRAGGLARRRSAPASRERREADLAPRPQLLGPAPRRAEALRRRAGRCAATAPRASSAPACWPCSSPSARRCCEARRATPLLLLDDVMSELDPERRERLVRLLEGGGQALITAAEPTTSRRRGARRWRSMPELRPRPGDGGDGAGGPARRRRPAAAHPARLGGALRAAHRGGRRRRGSRRSRRPGRAVCGERSRRGRSRSPSAHGTVTVACATRSGRRSST